MRVEHTLEIRAVCPIDNKPDVYECTIRATRVVKVEDILAAACKLEFKSMFQEELSQELHRVLAVEVETVGWHSGVRTRCTAGQ